VVDPILLGAGEAEGKSNLGVAAELNLSPKTVESHVGHIMDKLGIEPSPDEHRRVLAVLSLLRSAQTA
jgi:DNA-binding NarL/FixJ family response regulator